MPLIPPELAVIVVVPALTAVAKPVVPIVATDASLDVHVTADEISALVLLEYVAVAVNCCLVPARMVFALGVTDIDVSVIVSVPMVRVTFSV